MARAIDSDFQFDHLRQAHLYRQARSDELDATCAKMRALVDEFDSQYGHTRPPVRLRIRDLGLLRWRTASGVPNGQRHINLTSHLEILEDMPPAAYTDFLSYEQRRLDLNMVYRILKSELTVVDDWIERTRAAKQASESKLTNKAVP